jgi:hypothetical protein
MPPLRTQPISDLLKEQPKQARKEVEMARYFDAFQKLVLWMRDGHWDGEMLTVPMPPSLSNGWLSRAHWAEISAVKNQYYGFLTAMQSLRLLPKPPAEPPAVALISMHLYVWQTHDPAGAAAREKMPVDWMVANGYLAGDSDRHLQWQGLPEQTITRKEPQRIEFKITI